MYLRIFSEGVLGNSLEFITRKGRKIKKGVEDTAKGLKDDIDTIKDEGIGGLIEKNKVKYSADKIQNGILKSLAAGGVGAAIGHSLGNTWVGADIGSLIGLAHSAYEYFKDDKTIKPQELELLKTNKDR